MIEHRDDYSPDERDFWQRERYEKMTFAINNFDSVKQQKWLYRKFKFLTDYVDTSACRRAFTHCFSLCGDLR